MQHSQDTANTNLEYQNAQFDYLFLSSVQQLALCQQSPCYIQFFRIPTCQGHRLVQSTNWRLRAIAVHKAYKGHLSCSE